MLLKCLWGCTSLYQMQKSHARRQIPYLTLSFQWKCLLGEPHFGAAEPPVSPQRCTNVKLNKWRSESKERVLEREIKEATLERASRCQIGLEHGREQRTRGFSNPSAAFSEQKRAFEMTTTLHSYRHLGIVGHAHPYQGKIVVRTEKGTGWNR